MNLSAHKRNVCHCLSSSIFRNVSDKASVFCSTLLAATFLTFSHYIQADVIGATHTSLVSEFASFNTPGVVDGRVEAIAVEGDTVFVGGSFTQIHDPLGDEIIDQPYLFAYSKSSGDIIRTFDPVLNNDVFALERTGDGTGVFAGGVFTNLNGEIRKGLVKIDNNGDRVSGFSARPNALVKSLVRLNDTLYLGGNFDIISGTPVENLAAIDTSTGVVQPTINLDFGGPISTNTITGVQGVDEIDITSDGQLMVVVGNFSTINGISRHRLAVIEMDGGASVSAWNTDVFDLQCPVNRFPQYILGMDIAPDDSYFVTATTGFRIFGNPACDTVGRYDLDDLSDTDVQPTWVNFTGGDSVYEVVSTGHAVYAGGHFEFLDNDFGNGNNAGPGSTKRAGLAALDPLNGLTLRDWQSDRNPRGLGVFALLSEDDGLYIGDDTDFLNGTEHKKLKFLPITTDTIARPELPALPTTILSIVNNTLSGNSFDGSDIGTTIALSNTGFNQVSGGMFVGGRLFHSGSNGGMWVTPFEDGVFGSSSSVDLFGVTESDWALSDIGGMFFDYEWSRVYFSIQGDSRLFYIAFTPATPFFGNDVFEAEQQGDIQWSDVSGMDVIGDHLYFARTDGTLYRADIDGAAVISGTTLAISGPGIDGRNWDNDMLAFLGEGDPVGQTIDAQYQFDASGSQTMGRVRTFEFEVTAGEPVELRLQWLDPTALVNLFVSDANGVLVASDNSSAGSPKWVTAPAGSGGTYTAKVIVKEGSTAYTLQVNPEEAQPEPLADYEFSSSGSNASGRFQSFEFDVIAGELVEAQVIWDDPAADVRVFLRDANGTLIERDTEGTGTSLLSAVAQIGGTWSVAVLTASDTVVNYDILVDTSDDFVEPEPLADFEFTSSGSNDTGRFQTFNFDVIAGETIDAQVIWDDPNADLRVFLRDENGSQIDRDTDGSGSPATLSAIAASTGTYSVAVRADSDVLVDYDVLIDTLEENPPTIAITSQPVDLTVIEGDDATFTVTATGIGTLAYQWFADGDAITDENSNTLTLNSVVLSASGTVYTVEVTDDNGTVTSDAADLTVEQPPVILAITSQPADLSVIEGQNASFSVSATGSGTLSYQWFGDGSAISLATSDTLTLSSVNLTDSGSTYSVVVTDENGSISSDDATLSVEIDNTPEATNIALTGSASQSSTDFGGVPARAIDGNTDGNYGNGSVTHTMFSSQPWWEVQLSELSTIETITLFNRTNNCCINRLSDYTVSILDDNGATVFFLVFSDAPDPSNTIDVGGVVGRTVRVQLNGTSSLSLAEVQVMGYANSALMQ